MHFNLPDRSLAAYDLAPPVSAFTPAGVGINNRTLGIHTAEGMFIWKTYQTHADAEAIDFEHRLLLWLGGCELSFAVPMPIHTREGDTLVASEEGWKALFAVIPGAPPDHGRIDPMAAVGAALGELHCMLANCPLQRKPHSSGYGDLLHVHPHIPDPLRLTLQDLGLPTTVEFGELLAWWRDELAELHDFTRNVYGNLPHQMTHGDYVPANTLIHGDRLTAILDFEMSQTDARAIDIASGLKFTLRLWERPDPLPFGSAFWQGYSRWIQPTAAEIAAMPTLIRLRDAVSAIWWMGRGLSGENMAVGVERMRDLQKMTAWLANNDGNIEALFRQ